MLISLSSLITLGACELGLRLFYPKFQYAAESDYQRDDQRIWSRNPNSIYRRPHPDNGEYHYVCHNNLALRQHRNFAEEDLSSSTNIGFFGDSFTENLRLPGPYSFTEPLDFLLNVAGQDFNTLNFGVDGYGSDQSFLAYRNFEYRDKLDHVFYIFTANDLRNIYENGIFILNEEGSLKRKPVEAPSLPIKILSKFHLTYLVVESIENVFFNTSDYNKRVDLSAFIDHSRTYRSDIANSIERDLLREENWSSELGNSINIFNTILRQWKDEVESHGGKFYIILLPRPMESLASKFIDLDESDILDLYRSFQETVDSFNYDDFFFKNDGHWNEAANYNVARSLFEFISGQHNLERLASKTVDEKLYTYYSAFSYSWKPDAGREPFALDRLELDEIKYKYARLELSEEEK